MSRKRILIADDEEDLRMLLKYQLEERGYEVLTAYDGLDAISICESEKPDLLLLDLMMPVMSGYDVTRKLRENPATAGIPVVMLSAAGQGESIKEALQAGARDYLVKPVDTDKLVETMEAVLASSR